MKNVLTLLFVVFVSISCKSQTLTDYINHYNTIVPKLNNMVPTKTQYYGQPFSSFNTALQNNNILVYRMFYDRPAAEVGYYNILQLDFASWELNHLGVTARYQMPLIVIEFQEHIPDDIETMFKSDFGRWSPIYENFFANYTIKEIRFVGINGYDNPDRSVK